MARQETRSVGALRTRNPASRPAFTHRATSIPISPLAIWALVALLLLADVVSIYHAIRGNPAWRTSIDFGLYLHAANAIAHGQNPYSTGGPIPLFYGAAAPDPYAYPPALAEFLLPFTHFGDTVARYAWLLLGATALALSIAVLLRGFGARVGWPWLCLAIACAGATYAVRDDLYHGQVNFALLLLLTAGLALQTRGHPIAAGMAFGVLCVIKPFAAVLLFYLIWRRARRVAITCCLTGAGLFALSFVPTLPSGLAGWHGWVRATQYYAASARPDNYALHGLLLRLFTPNAFTTPWRESSLALQALSTALLLFMVLVLVAAVPSRPLLDREEGGALLLAEAGLILGLGMTYGPLTEGDHLFLLLPTLVGTIVLARRRHLLRTPSRHIWTWAAAAWALVFVLRASPVRGALFGLPSSEAWVRIHGLRILWTGQIGLLLFAASLLLACALRADRGSYTRALAGLAY